MRACHTCTNTHRKCLRRCVHARLHVCVPGCKPPTRAHAIALSVARTRPAFSNSACRAWAMCDRTITPRGTRLRARTRRQPLRCCKAAVSGDGMRRYDAVMVHHELDLLELRHASDVLRCALRACLVVVAHCTLSAICFGAVRCGACCRAVCSGLWRRHAHRQMVVSHAN